MDFFNKVSEIAFEYCNETSVKTFKGIFSHYIKTQIPR